MVIHAILLTVTTTVINLNMNFRFSFLNVAFQLFLSSSIEVNGFLRGIVVSSSLDGIQQAQIVDSSFGPDQTPVTG